MMTPSQIRSMFKALNIGMNTGIVISNGKGAAITMIGPVVDINAGALTVT